DLVRQRTSLELKSENLRQYNEKLVKEVETLEQKLKNCRLQVESLGNEICCLKKRESEHKDSEQDLVKKEQLLRDELKKQLESKNRQLNSDLNRQIAQNKSLKADNERLTDRLKVNEEKLNHLERDLNQKKQLVDFYKKKIEENQIKSDPVFGYANEQIVNDLKGQVKKMSDLVEKYKVETKNLRQSIQSGQASRQEMEEKIEKSDKTTCTLKERISGLKKQKDDLETRLNQEHKRVLSLESVVSELESAAQNKLKTLSQASHETLSMAQLKVKYAFKLAENFENLIKNLYESLLNRVEINRKAIRCEKEKREEKVEMKFALDLASSVLNMSHHELDDLLKDKDNFGNEPQKLLFEFEQCLNTSKREQFDDVNIVCEMISTRIEDKAGQLDGQNFGPFKKSVKKKRAVKDTVNIVAGGHLAVQLGVIDLT
ncbi:centlein, partial [Brachionus plicatilis]